MAGKVGMPSKREMVDEKLQCGKCGIWQHPDNFTNKLRLTFGKDTTCRACNRAYTASNKYGIDFDLADQLCSVRCCQCCGEKIQNPINRAIHHIGGTGKNAIVRGVVCRQCNMILGDESEETKRKIACCMQFVKYGLTERAINAWDTHSD